MEIHKGMPLLARGNHARGSGAACVMNVIDYITGASDQVSDAPITVWPTLRHLAILLNDQGCRHADRRRSVNCARCSRLLWGMAGRLIGTNDAYLAWERRRPGLTTTHLMHRLLLVSVAGDVGPYPTSAAHRLASHLEQAIMCGHGFSTMRKVIDAFEQITNTRSARALTQADMDLVAAESNHP